MRICLSNTKGEIGDIKCSFQDIIEIQVSILKETRTIMLNKLVEKTSSGFNELVVKNKGGMGKRSGQSCIQKNDFRMYTWIDCSYRGNEYRINFFHSDIDKDSGNCHCQIGKVMFVKGLVKNKSDVKSPNDIWEGKSNKKSTMLIFNSYKWENPLEYFDEEYIPVNGIYLSVDDILNNDEVVEKTVDAFFRFIVDDNA